MGRLGMNEGQDDEKPMNPAAIEKAYIAAVMKEVISNGTSLSCNSSNVFSSSEEGRIAKAANSIYELSAIFYYVRIIMDVFPFRSF